MMGAAVAAAALLVGVSATTLVAAADLPPPIAGPESVVWGGVAALPVVAGLVELAKRSGFPDRFAGVLALVLGVAGGLGFGHVAGVHVATALVQGVVVGLAASGAWSTSRHALGIGSPRAGSGGGVDA